MTGDRRGDLDTLTAASVGPRGLPMIGVALTLMFAGGLAIAGGVIFVLGGIKPSITDRQILEMLFALAWIISGLSLLVLSAAAAVLAARLSK